ncbi:hypothetical protein V5799_031178 [Amblyomma americanum]|uniref:Uncharacterized protein n=1 Tax=Amblyomma americanum TaxID=6943 RepID=A0AAQ4ELM6_AMBAM
MAALPCAHLLCESCFDGCVDSDHYACPMDKTTFQTRENVTWTSPPRENLAQLQVRCWNSQHGCDFAGPAEDLLEHYEKHCAFHVTQCPRCRDTVLRKNLPRHYIAGCTAVIASSQGGASKDTAVTVPLTSEVVVTDEAPYAYKDVLAMVQGGVDQLVETLLSIGSKFMDHAESDQSGAKRTGTSLTMSSVLEACNEATAALTQGFCNLKQSLPPEVARALPSSLEDALASAGQRILPAAPLVAALREFTTSGGSSTAGLVVLTLFCHPWDEGTTGSRTQFVSAFPVHIGETPTGVYVTCFVSRHADFAAVYAKSTPSAEWGLPDVFLLRPGDRVSPALRGWVMKGAVKQSPEWRFSHDDYILRCLYDFRSRDCRKTFDGRTQIDFVLQLRRKAVTT